jgi:hypothetical protein
MAAALMLPELNAGPLMLIMKIGPLPDALDPGFHCVRTRWIRGFMAFRLAQHARTVMLMVPVRPESGFLSADRRCVRGCLGYRAKYRGVGRLL